MITTVTTTMELHRHHISLPMTVIVTRVIVHQALNGKGHVVMTWTTVVSPPKFTKVFFLNTSLAVAGVKKVYFLK